MNIEVLEDASAAAARAAALIAADARAAVSLHGQFTLAVSGGRTPWLMLQALASHDVPWRAVHVFQVDERVAPDGHADRNWTRVREALLERVALPPENAHPMPVELPDLAVAAATYAATLESVAGRPAVFDVVHLGLGPDGHTASLVPRDPALAMRRADVAQTATYQGRRRLTLTYPVLNRARRLVWLVTGADKAGVLPGLLAADPGTPAGRVSQRRAVVIADRAAAAGGESAP
jgi:6-phosphogluconolactonase